MQKIQIRKFQESDTPLLINLFQTAVHAINKKHYTAEQLAAWAPDTIDQQKWHDVFLHNVTLVAELHGAIVGFIEMTKTGFLEKLYIHKDYQGRFISLLLFKELETIARNLGLAKITTHCSITAKIPAQRMRFTVIKEQIVTRSGVTMTNFIMEKIL